ncbi:hypothetical protein V494_01806 [Pseudogymnoascus sp. VKM F-4513 (FW-928)]|nr:hypothetical protein V494_01806 [Pseudogymnoascus sp. VKM F-4513 (FW-928)]
MSDDKGAKRQSHPADPPPGATAPPDHVDKPKIYEVFDGTSTANALPEGYGQNSAGRRPQNVSLTEAAKTVRVEDFKNIHTYPCVREGLLTAIGGGFAVGGTRMLFGTPIIRACNWAAGTFCLLGIGSYEFCLQKRRLEKINMKRAVEIIDRKKAEKQAEQEQKRAERRRKKEEEDAAVEARKRSNWKFW